MKLQHEYAEEYTRISGDKRSVSVRRRSPITLWYIYGPGDEKLFCNHSWKDPQATTEKPKQTGSVRQQAAFHEQTAANGPPPKTQSAGQDAKQPRNVLEAFRGCLKFANLLLTG